MGSIHEVVKTANTTVRTVTMAAAVGIVGSAGYLVYDHYMGNQRKLQEAQGRLVNLQQELNQRSVEIDSLKSDIAEKTQQIDKLETAMHLLKTDQRLARLKVISVSKDDQGLVTGCELEFMELGPTGELLSEPKKIQLPSDVVYVDNWVVKFDDNYVEQADIERGTSLVLFRRIFSENQQPAEGVSLDQIGMRPQAYARGGAMTEFEKKLWSEFWEFANDDRKATEMGIRAANGEAVSMKVREGMSYDLQLRSSGGLSFKAVPSSN